MEHVSLCQRPTRYALASELQHLDLPYMRLETLVQGATNRYGMLHMYVSIRESNSQ